ncbi:MAG TPA: AMP-binding protein [Oculatellaceae cyanobacterium]|jgi:long-chain acyl-CoA synthetase
MSLLVERLLNRPDPGYPLILEGDTAWSLSEFREKVFRLASALQAKGIQPGDRVALMFMNQKEYLVSLFAILHAGAIAVPINITLPPEDILYVILNSGTRLVLTTQAFGAHFEGKPIPFLVANQTAIQYPSFEEAIASGNPDFAGVPFGTADDLRILMYTSGTTGKPKGVMLSENNLLSNLEGITPSLQISQSDRLLLALPIFHAYGQIIALYALQAQGALHLVPQFSPKAIIQTLVEGQITVLPLVPTLFNVLLSGIQKAELQLPHLRACISGGASLPEKLLRQIEAALNIVVLEGYGMTETSPVIAVNTLERGSIPRSVGKPLWNVDVKLIDAQGNRIQWTPGETSAEGEIMVKAPSVMLGYYQLPEETAQAFDSEGYLHTGDLGHFDAEGNLYISGGRKKDLIIKAGENIAPVRIEEVLHHHPAVQNVAVVGIPDEKLGEEILACVECKPGHQVTEAELKKFCREHLSPFMTPAAIRFYDELPKNPSGKILKPQLREQNLQLLQKQ